MFQSSCCPIQFASFSFAAELFFQFRFGALKHPFPGSREIFSRPVDVERQHRKGRTIRLRFSRCAPFGGPFQGCRDPLGILQRKNILLQVERVTFMRDAGRPSPCMRGFSLASGSHRTFLFSLKKRLQSARCSIVWPRRCGVCPCDGPRAPRIMPAPWRMLGKAGL